MSTESNNEDKIESVKLKDRWEIIYIDEKDDIHSVRLNNIKDILSHEYLSTKIKNKDKFHHLYKGQKKNKKIKINKLF